ncbi:MAG: 23S rRNA (guanosine(2251)-2'-O)-methyltransferase RlmB [Bacteroidetes bacterium]|nr:23S rRNA (guanosine(2251)-2'-O)-methyltransferase RlmB [Bacteroidota bacterium]
MKEAVESKREINKILIQKGISKEGFEEIRKFLTGNNYSVQYVPIQKLNQLTTGNHQGIVAYVSPIEYQTMEILAEQWVEGGVKPFILALDRITDVRNFGAIARTAECFGVNGILIPTKGSALVTADAVKASSGALNRIAVCKSDQFKNTLFHLQQMGIRLAAVTEKTKVSMDGANLKGAIVLLLGSEEDGITQDLLNMADLRVSIPMLGATNSLNVGVAAGIAMFEKLRQERHE